MRRLLVPMFAALVVLSVFQIARAQEEELAPGEGDAVVVEILRSVLKKHDVPAMAGAIVTSEGVRVIGVAGVRKRETEIPVTREDKWHLGSDTKAMTATMIAKLVEEEQIAWDTTVGETFPKLRSRIDAGFREVTLLQLLSHRSGLAGDISLFPYRGKNGTRARLAVVMRELGEPPKHEPGSKHEYANMGYIVAGAMVEKRTGKSWQKNMEQHVFKPLEMKSVGYGGTGTPGKLDQPWGHTEEGTPDARNGPAMDNPPVMGPAGRVHCSMQDWARFIVDLLRGLKGEQALLEGASYKKLTTPPFGGDYALGWSVGKRGWGGGTVLNHGGSNTMNYANVWVAPKRDFAILVCVNQGGDAGFRATDAVVGALIEHQNSPGAAKSR